MTLDYDLAEHSELPMGHPLEGVRCLRSPHIHHHFPHFPQYLCVPPGYEPQNYLRMPSRTRPLTDEEFRHLSRPFPFWKRFIANYV